MKPKLIMPTRGKLVTAYKESGNSFWKYCTRYGKIIEDKEWLGLNDEPWRKLRYHIDGLEAWVVIVCGDVDRYGYGLIEDKQNESLKNFNKKLTIA